MVTGTRCPVVADLDTWTHHDWSDGLKVNDLDPLEALEVRTRNTTYEIVVMNPHNGEILVRGGQFFPVYTRARLAGASLGGSFLKLHGIYVGFSMEFHTEDGPIVTTSVHHIAVVRNSASPS